MRVAKKKKATLTQTINKAFGWDKTKKQAKLNKIATGDQITAMDYVLMHLGPYKKYFGKPSQNFTAMIHGEPGSGKTVFLLKFANWFSHNIGSVLYISAEEFGSPTLAEKLKKIKLLNENNLHFARSLDAISNYNYDLIVIDSVQVAKLSLDQFQNLKKRYDLTAIVLSVQKNKKGNFKGTKDWEHEVDMAANILFNKDGNRVMDTYKNRYGKISEELI